MFIATSNVFCFDVIELLIIAIFGKILTPF